MYSQYFVVGSVIGDKINDWYGKGDCKNGRSTNGKFVEAVMREKGMDQ
jgi:hypothetical protein